MKEQTFPNTTSLEQVRGKLNPVVIGLLSGIAGSILLTPPGANRWTSLAVFLVWGLFGLAAGKLVKGIYGGGLKSLAAHGAIVWFAGTVIWVLAVLAKYGVVDGAFAPLTGAILGSVAVILTLIPAMFLARTAAVERMSREWTLSVSLLVIGLLIMRIGFSDGAPAVTMLGYFLSVLSSWLAPFKLLAIEQSKGGTKVGVGGYVGELRELWLFWKRRLPGNSTSARIATPAEIKFECANCGQHISAALIDVDGTGPCPGCGTMVRIPKPAGNVRLRRVQGITRFLPPKASAIGVGALMLLVLLLAGARSFREPIASTALTMTPQRQAALPVNSTPATQTTGGRSTADSELIKRAVLARIQSLESDYQALRRQLISTQAAQSEYDGRAQDYVLQHKEACAALGFGIAGAGVLVNQNKKTTDGARIVGGLAALTAAYWVSKHQEEAKGVANDLVTIQANQQKYKDDILKLQSNIDTTQMELRQERAKL